MMKRMATVLVFLCGLFVFWILIVGYNLLTGPHTDLGVVNGRLTGVPPSPNAVSTFAVDSEHQIEPIVLTCSASHAMQQADEILKDMCGSTIVQREGHYLLAEFQSCLFRFIDDVEILCDEATSTLHFRSASRLGHSDLGKNRERMEEFRRRFHAIQNQ